MTTKCALCGETLQNPSQVSDEGPWCGECNGLCTEKGRQLLAAQLHRNTQSRTNKGLPTGLENLHLPLPMDPLLHGPSGTGKSYLMHTLNSAKCIVCGKKIEGIGYSTFGDKHTCVSCLESTADPNPSPVMRRFLREVCGATDAQCGAYNP